MATCPEKTACALTRNISMKEALRVWQSFYCEGGYVRCERYKLVQAGLPVPARLLPNGRIQHADEQPIGDPTPPSTPRAA